ncbi:hypothetical protein [uncultured Pantoea sp.]|uniref:gp53-like domain-containing protein n=1 Tax=uncultured Pantoea sp. TaxID=218084 RepID=UPI0025F808D2|nr:hypothetical protein [uncultured Pantoea sp.]
MDRLIVYPGAIPLETDLLNTNIFAMTGMAKLASVIMGNNTYLYGLVCTPDVAESLAVSIGEGQIYSLHNTDGTPYSSLAADTTHTLLKQGLNPDPVTFHLSAPATPGHSINYLIQVAYNDVDGGQTVLPYYNAADPAMAFSGPDNTGNAQSTVRSGACIVRLKAGVAAVAGSQITPPPDAGYTSAWVITINYGDRHVNAEDIRPADGAPFLPVNGLIGAIQQGRLTYGMDSGTVNHYQVSYQPAIGHISDGMRLHFRAKNTNSGPSALAVSHFPAASILTAEHQELPPGQISQGHTAEVEWNSAIGAWILSSHKSSYTKDESDQKYYSRDGGHISGDVVVQGNLTIEKSLNVGEAELTEEGDVRGKLWEGSLAKWLKRQLPFTSGSQKAWHYKSPNNQLIIQGGMFDRASTTTSVSFPIVFPSGCFNVHFSLNKTYKKSVVNPYISVIDNTHFELNAGSGESGFYWVAFGQ